MPRKEQGWITFQASEEERKILDTLSKNLQRTKTEILRELLRELEQRYMQLPQSIPNQKQQKEDATTQFIEITNSQYKFENFIDSRDLFKKSRL